MADENKQEETEEPKIGVYVCHCGINIGGVVDIDEVKDYAATLPNVEVSEEYKYFCSDPGQDMIEDVKEGKVSRVVVAACSPRLRTNLPKVYSRSWAKPIPL